MKVFHKWAKVCGLIMIKSLLRDSEIIVSMISSKADGSCAVAWLKRDINYLATSSDREVRCKLTKWAKTSSLIFFSFEKINILMLGNTSSAFSNLSWYNLINNLMVSKTSVSAFDPSNILIESMTLLIRLFSYFY